MRITYHYQLHAQCPVDNTTIDVYEFTIESAVMIKVETIIECFVYAAGGPIFQEELTDRVARKLGAKVTSVGWHSGVKTICEAP